MTIEDFQSLKFLTKRLGDQGYNGLGTKLNLRNWFLVFIAKVEINGSTDSLSRIRKELLS